jgi:hypothetical protein
MPGNFGVRALETMPFDLREVFIQQRKNIELEFRCDYRKQAIPELLQAPDQNDYLTDEESDDAPEFEVKVPDLSDLIDQFEKVDPVILDLNEKRKAEVKALDARGFKPEPRHDINNKQATRVSMLNKNIDMQRQKQAAILPGFMQDLNEVTKRKQNKMYLK